MDLAERLRKLQKLCRLLPERRYRRALQLGVAAAIEHGALLRTLDCATVVDVGANVGQFSLAARVCMPGARIIAFEPLAAPARIFGKVFEHDPAVQLHQLALGAAADQVRMNVSRRVDSSSLLAITELQQRVFPGTSPHGTEEVRVEPLSAVIAADALLAPALLKLDVQGFELEVLRGCGDLLARFAYVYAECSFIELYHHQALAHEIIGFLDQRGFALDGAHNLTYDQTGRSVQGDFFFTRRRPSS